MSAYSSSDVQWLLICHAYRVGLPQALYTCALLAPDPHWWRFFPSGSDQRQWSHYPLLSPMCSPTVNLDLPLENAYFNLVPLSTVPSFTAWVVKQPLIGFSSSHRCQQDPLKHLSGHIALLFRMLRTSLVSSAYKAKSFQGTHDLCELVPLVPWPYPSLSICSHFYPVTLCLRCERQTVSMSMHLCFPLLE